MMIVRFLFMATLVFAFVLTGAAQENIPLGAWRTHISFNDITLVISRGDKVYAAASNGVLIFNKSDNTSETLYKGAGLSNTGVVALGVDESSDAVLVAYDNGTFDLIANGRLRSYDPSRNTVLPGSRRINHIMVNQNFAYLSTDYGVLVFDLARREIKETWRDLGPGGSTRRINASVFLRDSIFLATENGIMGGDPRENLLDFNKWRRFSGTGIDQPITGITSYAGTLYATVAGSDVYTYDGADWTKENLPEAFMISSVKGTSNGLLVTVEDGVWMKAGSGEYTSVLQSSVKLNDAVSDAAATLWIASSRQGLMRKAGDAVISIVPNGPFTNKVMDLHYHDRKMYMVSGGFSAARVPLREEGVLNVFSNGVWTQEEVPMRDLTSVFISNEGVSYVGSFGYGVLEKSNGGSSVIDETNSPLLNTDPPGRNVNVTGLTVTTEGLWVANYGVSPSLHLKKSDNTWQSVTFNSFAGRYPMNVLGDRNGNVWARFDPERGGGIGVYDSRTNQQFLLNNLDQQGELPSNTVYALALDRDGNVWAGTDQGVAYFFDVRSDAVKPIFENRFLLRDERVKAIAVDGGNRKWMGTERGLWLFTPSGEELIAHFTTENSPLLSNNIVEIEINAHSGEVFIGTDRGLNSFRADATFAGNRFSEVKIFPNPVSHHFNGLVGISGVANDATVKITDPSGRLVWQTRANGGTASWNVRDYHGRRVSTGVFLVYAITSDGRESIVGKIAVIN